MRRGADPLPFTGARARGVGAFDFLHPTTRLILSAALVAFALGLPTRELLRIAIYATIGISVAIVGTGSMRVLIKRALTVLVFFLFVSIPLLTSPRGALIDPTPVALGVLTVARGSLVLAAATLMKAAASIAVLLGAFGAGGVSDFTCALEGARIPKTFVVLVAMTFRSLDVVRRQAFLMQRAMTARGWLPRSLVSARSIGTMLGGLFTSSLAYGERSGLALEARGFSGTIPRLHPPRVRPTDFIVGAVWVAVLAIVTLVVPL